MGAATVPSLGPWEARPSEERVTYHSRQARAQGALSGASMTLYGIHHGTRRRLVDHVTIVGNDDKLAKRDLPVQSHRLRYRVD